MPLPTYSTPFIEVPPPRRRPLRGGLFDAIGAGAVHDEPRLGGHGVGVAYLSPNCTRPVGVLPVPCQTDNPPVITTVACDIDWDTSGAGTLQNIFDQEISCDCGMHISYGAPFNLFASACENPMQDAQTIRQRARNTLAAGVQRGVEQIFSTVLPALAEDITPAACQYGITSGLAALEGQMASCYDGSGIIHAPAFAATYISGGSLFSDGNTTAQGPLETVLGTRFALGGGYTGDGPDGEAATDCTFWMYVTPSVDVYRGPVSIPLIQDTDHNTTMAVAQQTYAITIDCGGVYGVRVNVDPCNC